MRSMTAATPEMPPHLARSGWTTATAPPATSSAKAASPIAFSPAASGDRRRGGEALPLGRRPVGAQRLLEPGRRRRGQRVGHRRRGGEIPGLVGVDHQRGAGARGGANLGEVGDVALGAEADLELERGVAGVAQRGDRVAGPLGIDAAGIDRHAGLARSPSPATRDRWRQSGRPRRRAARSCRAMSTPAIAWAIGPGSPDWIASTAVRAVSSANAASAEANARPTSSGASTRLDQAGAMLGAARREVAPGLAPAVRAFGILHPDEHRRAGRASCRTRFAPAPSPASAGRALRCARARAVARDFPGCLCSSRSV